MILRALAAALLFWTAAFSAAPARAEIGFDAGRTLDIREALSQTRLNSAPAAPTAAAPSAPRFQVKPEAAAWADKNIQGLAAVPPEKRVPVYYIVSVFYGRLMNWRSDKPFYDSLYADGAMDKKYPFFAKDYDGLFMVIMLPGQKLTDLPPYRSVAGKTVEQVFGYPGDTRSMDALDAESSRQSLVVAEVDLSSQPTGAWNTYYHEFGHLLHLTMLTPTEFSRLDELYAAAKSRDGFLDDYAAENASEYFAQGLEAYLSETKPGETWKYFKHTRQDLLDQDPDLFSFIVALTN